jgi:hypothetical protein
MKMIWDALGCRKWGKQVCYDASVAQRVDIHNCSTNRIRETLGDETRDRLLSVGLYVEYQYDNRVLRSRDAPSVYKTLPFAS